jgi:hypothetical protein
MVDQVMRKPSAMPLTLLRLRSFHVALQHKNPPRMMRGRVLNETIHFEQNVMVDWTSQPGFDFVFDSAA